MSANSLPLTEIISLRPRFTRSVHLERDFFVPSAADGYVLTRGSASSISLLARGVADPAYRAQCLSGPYGAGKSALALYVGQLLNRNTNGSLRQRAEQTLTGIARDLIPRKGTGYIPVVATGTREGVGACLMRGLRQSLSSSGCDGLLTALRRRRDGAGYAVEC